eukprot:5508758-Pleurochrysis_carterae.AAC.2
MEAPMVAEVMGWGARVVCSAAGLKAGEMTELGCLAVATKEGEAEEAFVAEVVTVGVHSAGAATAEDTWAADLAREKEHMAEGSWEEDEASAERPVAATGVEVAEVLGKVMELREASLEEDCTEEDLRGVGPTVVEMEVEGEKGEVQRAGSSEVEKKAAVYWEVEKTAVVVAAQAEKMAAAKMVEASAGVARVAVGKGVVASAEKGTLEAYLGVAAREAAEDPAVARDGEVPKARAASVVAAMVVAAMEVE